MEQILAEMKSVASRANNLDVMVGARLDILDGSLNEIKTTITAAESTLSAVTNWVAELEKHMEEAKDGKSAAEDGHSAHYTSISTMEKTVKELQLKIDDLLTFCTLFGCFPALQCSYQTHVNSLLRMSRGWAM